MADSDISVRIPRPQPGEVVTVRTGGLVILAELDPAIAQPDDEGVPADTGPAYGDIVDYTAVDIIARSSVVTHAAEVRQRNERTRVAPYTLCASGDYQGYRVKARRRIPLAAVTCVNCRKRLRAEGVVD